MAASPWYYGSAPDVARYALTAVLLLAGACAMATGRAARADALPAALGLPMVGVIQLLFGASVAPFWTADALLVLLGMIAAMIAVQELARDRSAGVRLTAAVLLSALAQAVFGAVSWSAAPSRIYGQSRADITMPFGSFVNHNHFAGFTEMPILLALGMAIGHSRRARRITPISVALAGVALALAAAELASRSRGGLLALAAGLLALGGLASVALFRTDSPSGRPRRLLLVACFLVVVLGFSWLAVAPAARQHLLTLLSGPSDASGSYRLAIARATLRLFAAHPLVGSGLGAYEDAVPPYKTSHGDVRTTHAESDVLEFFAEGGVLGVAAVGWLALSLGRRVRDRLRSGRDSFRKGIAIGAISGAAALGVHGLWDFNLRIPANALVFVVLLALASVGSNREEPEAVHARPRWPLTIGLGLLALISFWRAYGADGFEAAQRITDRNARIAALDRVAWLHPYLAEAWSARGAAWRDVAAGQSSLRSYRLARARADFSQALQLRPHWADAWAGRGWVRGMLGDLEGGARDLDRAVELDPTHPGIRLLRAHFTDGGERQAPKR